MRPRPRTKDTDARVPKKKVLKIFFRRSQKKGLQNFFQAKKIFNNFFSGDLHLRKPRERSFQIFRKVSGVFQTNFNGSKILLSSSRGQGIFRTLEISRPRTSKCVLEDSTSDSLPAPLATLPDFAEKTPKFDQILFGFVVKTILSIGNHMLRAFTCFLGLVAGEMVLNVLLLCFSSFVTFRATFSYYHDYERNV